jgi:aldose sugar dehydrogenase
MVPSDNPFYDQGRVKSQIWSYGHRNPLGIAFDAQGRLWNQEMGPKHGGDELNLVKKGNQLRLSQGLERQSLRRSRHS